MNAELPEQFLFASKVIFSQCLKYIFFLYQHWIGAEGTCIGKLTLGSISSASAASAASVLHQQCRWSSRTGVQEENVWLQKSCHFLYIIFLFCLSTHLSPPSLTWQIQGCQWAEQASETSQSPPHSPSDIFFQKYEMSVCKLSSQVSGYILAMPRQIRPLLWGRGLWRIDKEQTNIYLL